MCVMMKMSCWIQYFCFCLDLMMTHSPYASAVLYVERFYLDGCLLHSYTYSKQHAHTHIELCSSANKKKYTQSNHKEWNNALVECNERKTSERKVGRNTLEHISYSFLALGTNTIEGDNGVDREEIEINSKTVLLRFLLFRLHKLLPTNTLRLYSFWLNKIQHIVTNKMQ